MVVASNTKMMKFYRHLILRAAECTHMYDLAHYEKRLDISGLEVQALMLCILGKRSTSAYVT